MRERRERTCRACLVSTVATQLEAPLAMRHRDGVFGLVVGKETGGDRRSGALGRRRAVAECERLLEPASALAQMTPRQPECRQCRRERQRAVLVLANQIPAQRGAQVRLLGFEAPSITLARQRHVVGSVLGANLPLLAARGKLIERELTNRLEQPRSRVRTRLGRALNQAVVDESRKGVEDACWAVGTRDRFRCADREATRKYSQALELPPRAVVEQVEAPRDRVTQRSLAVWQVARPTCEQLERMRKPFEDLVRRYQSHPRGRELDRQRQTVYPSADGAHCSRVLLRELEIR